MEKLRKALDLARQERGLPRPELVADEDALHEVPRPLAAEASTAAPRFEICSFAPVPESLERHRILPPGTQSPAAEAFRRLRTQVVYRMHERRWRTLAVVSPSPGDGRTTAAVNLAIALAADSTHPVYLIDLDFRRPAIAARFGLTPDRGIEDFLQGTEPLERCLYRPEGFSGLTILPARLVARDDRPYLAGPEARALVDALRRAVEPEGHVIFDLPPALVTDATLAFTPLVDCGLLVVAEGTTRRADVVRCMELLKALPVVGSVLNRAFGARGAG